MDVGGGSMRGRSAVWRALGVAVGAAGAVWLAQAYGRARRTCPPFRRRTYRSSRDLIAAFGSLWRQPEQVWSLLMANPIERPLAQKLALAVAGTSGTRTLAELRAFPALTDGLDRGDVESLLRGEADAATPDEAPAVYYALHYGATQGHPAPDLERDLVAAYGVERSQALHAYLQLAMLAALVGGTCDALLSRLLGRPAPGSRLADELAVVGVFTLGIVPLAPALLWRAWRAVA